MGRKNYSYTYVETPDDAIVRSSIDLASNAIIMEVLTSSTDGSEFIPFPSIPCAAIDLVNMDNAPIEYIRNGSGSSFPIANGSSRTIIGILNANQISLRRIDQINVSISIHAEAIII